MQLIQTPSRVLLCDLTFSINTACWAIICHLIFNEAFINHPLEFDIQTVAVKQHLTVAMYTFLFALLFSIMTIIYRQFRKKPIGLKFIIDHHGIHYGEHDEMITISWQTFVGMQTQGFGPFQHIIIYALHQKTPLIVKLKAFNFTQREEFKQVLKQKIRFYYPALNHRYIPELI